MSGLELKELAQKIVGYRAELRDFNDAVYHKGAFV